MKFETIELNEAIITANTGADAITRAPIVDYETSFRCLRIGDISNKRDFNKWGYTSADEKIQAKFQLMKDDILLARTGNTIGVSTIIEEDLNAVFNNGLIRLKINSEFNPRFIYYLVSSSMFTNFISQISGGTSTQPNVKIQHVLQFPIPKIEFSIQTKIVKILSSLDYKISNNINIISTLEELSQTLFKRWFIDFEFPNEDGLPYKSSGGKMVESELGEIPEGWELESLYEFANVIYGAPFSSKLFNEDKQGLPLIRIRDLKSGDPNFYTTEQHKKATIIHPGDLLIGMDAEFTPTLWKGNIAYLNQRVCKIEPNKLYIHPLFLYYGLKPYMTFLENSKVGTTVIHLSKSDMDKCNLIMPDKKTLELFFAVVDGFYNQIINLNKENKRLQDLRDSLLPKLLSGEIEIPEESVVD